MEIKPPKSILFSQSNYLAMHVRHFKEFNSADDILDFFDIIYNFIDEQRLKKEKKWRTPAQRAGIKINLPKRLRLLNFIHFCMGTED